jgi:uncharacterized repeat protein (TIGR03837 family)
MRVIYSIDIFCNVIDNFGDVGVCWRLARQLAVQEKMRVCLWVNDLARLKVLRPFIDTAQSLQQSDGFSVRDWRVETDYASYETADLVIEAFGCKLPQLVLQAMAQQPMPPVWINLEYLSAEDWVEGCHQLSSPQSSPPLTKYFFFPGFTARTGGLLKEVGLDARRYSVQHNEDVRTVCLDALGISLAHSTTLVSLFCYPAAPVDELFAAMQINGTVHCVVPQGVASEAVARFLQQPAVAGARATYGQLTVQVMPFLQPDAYDQLLWCCDLNFVRGEDSLVRAIWSGRPLVWQPYVQAEGAHIDKLEAFLARYVKGMPAPLASVVERCWQGWNGAKEQQFDWLAYSASLLPLRTHNVKWSADLAAQGELARGLVEFASKIG